MLSPERAIQIEKTAISKGLHLEKKDFQQTASGKITLQKMLPNAKDIHGLLSSPLDAAVYDSPFFRLYSLPYTDNVFFGSRLDDLLDTARPKNRIKKLDSRQGKWGALADWEETNERILNFHKPDLEPYWSEFMMGDQKKLHTEAMRALHPEEIGNYFNSLATTAIRRDIAIKRFGEIVGKLLRDEEGNDHPSMLWGLSYHWRNLENTSIEEVINFVHSLPQETIGRLIDKEILFPYHTVLDTQKDPDLKPKHSHYDSWGVGEFGSLKEQYLGDNRYKIFLRDSWIELRLDPDGTVVEIERYIHDQQDKGLIPHFAWVHVKNTGQRLFLSSQVPDWITTELDPRANTYLGLTVAKHLSGITFPYKERLSTRHNPQAMREAQIVMQASKRRSEIMPFFLKFEEFIGNHFQPA